MPDFLFITSELWRTVRRFVLCCLVVILRWEARVLCCLVVILRWEARVLKEQTEWNVRQYWRVLEALGGKS